MWQKIMRNLEWLVVVALLVGAVMAVGCQGTTIDNTSAYAGPDKYIVLGASCSIQGFNVFKNSITQKDTALGNPSWVSISAPVTPVNFTQGSNITNSNIYELTFTPSALGIYEFKFSTSILGALSEDTVKVIVIPSADVGPDQTVPVNTPVTVTGTSPVDSSHLVWWDCTSAPAGVDTSGLHFTQNVATFTPTVVGIYTFSYIIGKNNEIEADYFFKDTVTITVVSSGGGNTPPVANAGTAKTGISIGSQVLLSGSGSDADNDPFTYKWTLANPPTSIYSMPPTLSGADTFAPYFTPVESGTYTATLIVNDGKVDSAPSTVTITVDTQAGPVTVDSEALMLSAVSGKAFLVANSSSVLYDVLEFSTNTAGGTAPYSHIGKYINNTWYNYGISWDYFVSLTLARLGVSEPGISYTVNPNGYMTETATTLNVPGYPQNGGLTGTAAETWLKVAALTNATLSGHKLSAWVDVYTLSYQFNADGTGVHVEDVYSHPFTWVIDATSRKVVVTFTGTFTDRNGVINSNHRLFMTERHKADVGKREFAVVRFNDSGAVIDGKMLLWDWL